MHDLNNMHALQNTVWHDAYFTKLADLRVALLVGPFVCYNNSQKFLFRWSRDINFTVQYRL